MSDTTLRNQIADYMYSQAGSGRDPFDDENLSHVDDIIALLREAMLSQDAVSHAIVAHMNAEHTSPMAAAITAALDAITGDDA